jgi:hypothetical protein
MSEWTYLSVRDGFLQGITPLYDDQGACQVHVSCENMIHADTSRTDQCNYDILSVVIAPTSSR